MKSNTGSLACYVRVEELGRARYFDVGYPVRRIYKRAVHSSEGRPREDRAQALHGRRGLEGFVYNELEGKGLFGSRQARHPARVPAQLHLQRRQEGRRGHRLAAQGLPARADLLQRRRRDLEVLDGQQRITSIGRFVTGKFAIKVDGKEQTFSSLPRTSSRRSSTAELLTSTSATGPRARSRSGSRRSTSPVCRSTAQELLNAIYSGPFVTKAKAEYSNSKNANMQKWSSYIKGDPKRQEVLDEALDWVSSRRRASASTPTWRSIAATPTSPA